MATFRNRNGKWQARVQTKGHAALSKTFINKADAERWAKQVEVEMQKGSYTNLVLAERTTFAKIIERYIVEVLPTMRGGKADFIRLKALARRPIAKLNMVALTPQKIMMVNSLHPLIRMKFLIYAVGIDIRTLR